MNAPLQLVRLSRVRGFLSNCVWYLEPDHLLLAETSFLRVTYRRFYYRDLQDVLLTPDPRWWWRAGLMPGLAALAGFCFTGFFALTWNLAHRLHGTLGDAADGAIGAALAAVCLQLLLGPLTRARIVTTTGTCHAPLVGRWGRAGAALPRLAERVLAAQQPVETAAP